MIRIQKVNKGDNYYTIIFTEGKDAFGILITLVDTRPMYVEFMKFDKNGKDIINVTEEDNPEEFNELKTKYFDHIMKYIKAQGN
jgi:hypothetical protein